MLLDQPVRGGRTGFGRHRFEECQAGANVLTPGGRAQGEPAFVALDGAWFVGPVDRDTPESRGIAGRGGENLERVPVQGTALRVRGRVQRVSERSAHP